MYIYIAVVGNGVYNIKIKGMDKMPNIKLILDLRYYIEVRKEVSTNQPVYLIRNGRGAYAIVEVDELERLKAAIKLMIRGRRAVCKGKGLADSRWGRGCIGE